LTDLVRPAYGTGSLADLLPSVLAGLGVPGASERSSEASDAVGMSASERSSEASDAVGISAADPLGLAGRLAGVRRVAVLLVDGLGYRLLPVAAPVAPTLADAAAGRLGELRTLTSGFPSTTPTSLASFGTGAPPGAHGLVGFTVNVPGTTRVLTHTEWTDDPDPRRWQPLTTQFGYAAAAGVAVNVVSRSEYAGSGLTASAYGGHRYRPADDPATLAARMLAVLGESEPPALCYGYHPDLDQVGHRYGVDSPQWRVAAADVDRLLARLVEGLPGDAALLVTADHGQLDVPAGNRFDLDTDPRLGDGVAVVAGEPRVRYLYPVPGATADVIAAWRAVLGDAARVAERDELVAEGWFGPVPGEHLARLGEVIVACRDRHAVLATAHEPDRVARLVAFHGSWTATEMLVPLLIVTSAG
jgi:hypothetical protein